jgi:hypothetical protein
MSKQESTGRTFVLHNIRQNHRRHLVQRHRKRVIDTFQPQNHRLSQLAVETALLRFLTARLQDCRRFAYILRAAEPATAAVAVDGGGLKEGHTCLAAPIYRERNVKVVMLV